MDIKEIINEIAYSTDHAGPGRIRKTHLIKNQFKQKYAARAHLNIFIAKELTKELRDVIEEEFENELILYYYSDIGTALQINDRQTTEFTVLIDGQERKLSIINYDLHVKGTNEILYGVIVSNDNHKIQQDKWLWKLDEFLTADGILKKYKIKFDELPQSSRQMTRFQNQLSQILAIDESLIDDTDWIMIQQIKSSNPNIEVPKITLSLSKEIWTAECKKSFRNVDLPLIPVVVIEDNNHWIEWIKMVYIESQNIYVGISFQYAEDNDAWSVQSICLDRSIYNKYSEHLKNFNVSMSVTEIKFIEDQFAEIPASKIHMLVRGFTRKFFHDKYEELILMIIFHWKLYYQVSLKRCIDEQAINNINWSNLKVLKSQSTNENPIDKIVTITPHAMKEFCFIALYKLNNNNNNNLIPIVVIDKHNHNYHEIEWVLIVHIIHQNCDVGISFRYNGESDEFVATAIYLDREEIESKHKSVGLNSNYFNNIKQFKNDKGLIIDDYDDTDDDDDDSW